MICDLIAGGPIYQVFFPAHPETGKTVDLDVASLRDQCDMKQRSPGVVRQQSAEWP